MARKKKTVLSYTKTPATRRWFLVPSEGLDAMTARLAARLQGKTFHTAADAVRLGLNALGETRIRTLSAYAARYPGRAVPFSLRLADLDEALAQLQSVKDASEEDLAAQLGVVAGLEYELSMASGGGA